MSKRADWHYLEWNPARASRFWDFVAESEAWQQDYFSKQVGAGIVQVLRRLAAMTGRVVDYGCGPGYLVDHLLASGIRCEAVDFSPDSVDLINTRLRGNPLWGGAHTWSGDRLPFADGSVDLILCIETIEHVLPEHVDGMLAELRRVLKPGTGRLFMSTPNAENLSRSEVFCAECGSVFHRYQHVSSFDARTLSSLLEAHGFRTEVCTATDFGWFQRQATSPLNWSIRFLARAGLRWTGAVLDVLRVPCAGKGGHLFRQLTGRGPHLFWFGGKA